MIPLTANAQVNWQAISEEREALAEKIKGLKKRKDELDSVIKKYLKNNDELRVIGRTYKIQIATKLKYPFALAIDYLSKFDSFPRELAEQKAILEKESLNQITEVMAKNASCNVPLLFKESLMKDLSYIAEKAYVERLISKEMK